MTSRFGRFRFALFSAAAIITLALGSARIPASSAGGAVELPQLPEEHSVNGSVTVNLTAAVNPNTNLPAFQYKGVIGTSGPTIRMSPGETLKVNYANHLPPTGGHCAPQNIALGIDFMDDTNLHYHGMKVSPNPPADNVLNILLMPGQNFAYSVPVPVDDAPGMYWYHAHPHCESNRQLTGGVVGTLIINGIEKYYPQVANMPERLLVLQNQLPPGVVVVDMKARAARNKALHAVGATRAAAARARTGPRTTQSTSTNPDCAAPPAYTVTLNGHPVDPPATPPQISIGPGQKQFWRVANESANEAYDIALIGPNGQRAPFQVIARDGQPLSYHDQTGEYVQVTDYLMMPAARAEFIATGPSGPGWTFQTLCVDTGPAGGPEPQRVLATINSQGYNGPTALAATDNIPPTRKPAFDILTYPVAQHRTMVFSEDSTGTQFFINGKQFDPASGPMVTAKVGTVEEWTIVNTSQELHAFHIHQIHFLVESIGGVHQGPDEVFLDTVVLPFSNGQANSNVVKLLMDFTDPIIVGEFVFHCHMLEHEDAGMMAKIQIVQ